MRLIGLLLSIGLFVCAAEGIVGTGLKSWFRNPTFNCDGNRELDYSWRCDGHLDCNDKTDERNCEYEDCIPDDPYRFSCKDSNRCILDQFVCDGINDCADGSDEINCSLGISCSAEFFVCADNSTCYPKSFMCDGHPDCPDKSDESSENCHGTLHGYAKCLGKFACGYGICLEDEKFVCDGNKNCPDGKDELPATCQSHPDCKNCTQHCTRHSHGVTCGCDAGYELAEDGGTCNDVDECARGICSQNCRNSKGSFTCSCKNGFKLVNGTKCENKVKATYVWYSGDAFKGREVILERDGRERKFRISSMHERVSSAIMPHMQLDIDNDKLYTQTGDTLYSMSTNTRRLSRPSLEKVLSQTNQTLDFAVDPATGNIYFSTYKGFAINVCETKGLCVSYAPRRPYYVSNLRIVRLSDQTRVFWKEGTQVMSGSLDGQEIRTVFKVMNGHPILYFVVDEQSEKMYLVESHLLEVDVATGKARRLTKLNFKNSSILWNMAVDDDKILVQSVQMKSFHEYIGHRIFNQILMIDRQTGDHLGLLEIPSRQQLHSVMRKSSRPVQNPCSDDKCSHVCVPSSGVVAYKCLCPPGMHLDEGDDSTCVPQEGEEQVYFVNGTRVSVYVYEGDELYLNQDFDLNVAPVAIATSLDMNLLYASQHKIYELMRDGSTKQYQVPGVRTMVVDPVDNVLYAANEYELLAVNLKTSEVALIRSGDYIKHMDIDPLNRVLYAETTGSEMYSFEIGAWDRVELDSLAQTSDHEERNWSFNPLLRTIQPDVALVLDGGVCEIADYLPRGFECHRQLPSRGHQNHSNHLPRLLARAGPPVVALKGAACDTMKCNFCVSANGSQGKKALEPVCVCPYGHELGADGVSCNKACAPQMLRCKDEKQCVHQSRRCDGYKDCQDGSDELNCAEHDCGENFKCHLSGICIAARNRCDGVFDCADHSDEDHCQKRDCPTSQFKCEDGFCLPETKRCDGIRDCFHGDDELNCPKVACKKNEFDCGNSKCISQDWLCDSQNDCPNGEDEANCPALVEKVRKLPKHDCNSKWIFCCKSGEQLPLNMKCNGIDECSDGSDEEHCNITCKAPQFQCNDGACLQESEVCDGIPHCPNAADEHNCKNKCSKKGLFECGADGICIPQAKICDGKKDCSDGADEVASRCPVTPKTPANSSCSANEYRCHDGKCIHLFEVCDGKKQCADGSDENEFCGKLDCKASKCSHDCYSNGPREVKCKCPKGYDLLDNGRTCDDIDECRKTPEVCSQFCKNLKGSFECFCAPGFRKNANGDCRVESGDAIMMIVENGRVETIDKNKNRDMLLNLPAAHIGSFDYDVSKGLVYVSDTDNGKIHRIPLNANNGKYKHELYDQLKPGALAFDWVARNLYFADHRPSIHVCHGVMAKGFCKILTEVNIKPVADAPDPAITSIALVPDEGIMFYSEASTGFIYRQNMDGTDKSPFPWAAGDRRPLSLTVDHVQRTLYWINAHGGSIESSNFEGGRIRRVVDNVAYVKTFTLFEDYLYYPEPDTESWVVVHKQSRKIRSSKHSPLGRASQVKIMHQVNQPAEVNRCFRSGCQQICLLKPHGFACACTDGQELSNDNRTCVKAAIDDTNLFDETWQEKLKKECSCENGGKCTLWKEMRGKYHCECPPGYHGDRCESGPTSSLVLTVFLICTFFIVFAGAGVYLMTLAARKERLRREARVLGVADRLTLIEKDADEEN